jgi:catechol 2,3-dioxygenase-like lactoylglutathione lyase family enzyme
MHSSGPATSSARASIIGVHCADDSLKFYCDLIGLKVERDSRWCGSAFERYWHLPTGSGARAIVLSANGRESGRVLLLEFDAPCRRPTHPPGELWFTGYNNVNFYTRDIRTSARDLLRRGFRFWSEPLFYQIGHREGAPAEVIFDGPDGVYVNLVEPQGDPDTNVGRIRHLLDERGCTPTGYSEVVTSSLAVRSTQAALAFFVDMLGLHVWMDFEVSGAGRNSFLAMPPENLSRNVFLVGDDLFGKIALFEPLNFRMPDRGLDGVAPNVGYLAMSFVVPDLERVAHRCRAAQIEIFSETSEIDLPAFGPRRSMLVRAPACQSLVELVQATA